VTELFLIFETDKKEESSTLKWATFHNQGKVSEKATQYDLTDHTLETPCQQDDHDH
jgi:hypothetical protein